jgi:hypothetical protein
MRIVCRATSDRASGVGANGLAPHAWKFDIAADHYQLQWSTICRLDGLFFLDSSTGECTVSNSPLEYLEPCTH